MNEFDRNKRLLKLLDELVKQKNSDAIELIETWIDTDTPSMKKSFDIVKTGGNFVFDKLDDATIPSGINTISDFKILANKFLIETETLDKDKPIYMTKNHIPTLHIALNEFYGWLKTNNIIINQTAK